MGEISGLLISGLRKKLADSTSANFRFYSHKYTLKILKFIHTYWLIINIYVFLFFQKCVSRLVDFQVL